MENIVSILHRKFHDALLTAFGDELPPGSETVEPEVTQATQAQFGHYQCNHALKLAKILGQNPRVIAARMLDAVDRNTPETTPMIAQMEVAGAGFINITLDPYFLSNQVNAILHD